MTRDEIFAQQRLERGFDDSDTWSLDYTLACWLLPRLKRFREVTPAVPSSLPNMEAWQEILEKIEFSLQCTIDDLKPLGQQKLVPLDQHPRWAEGYKLLGEWMMALWW